MNPARRLAAWRSPSLGRVDKRQVTRDNRGSEDTRFQSQTAAAVLRGGPDKGTSPGHRNETRAMFGVLDQMKDGSELKAWPLWRVHTLTGDRKGTWSLYVTRNWRLTFRIDRRNHADVQPAAPRRSDPNRNYRGTWTDCDRRRESAGGVTAGAVRTAERQDRPER